MLTELNQFRISIAEFLNVAIIETGFVYINFWHVVHFFTGAIVMFFIIKIFKGKTKERKLIILVAALLIYELFEYTFIVNSSSLFIGESFFDVVLDLVFGFLGGFLFLRF